MELILLQVGQFRKFQRLFFELRFVPALFCHVRSLLLARLVVRRWMAISRSAALKLLQCFFIRVQLLLQILRFRPRR